MQEFRSRAEYDRPHKAIKGKGGRDARQARYRGQAEAFGLKGGHTAMVCARPVSVLQRGEGIDG